MRVKRRRKKLHSDSKEFINKDNMIVKNNESVYTVNDVSDITKPISLPMSQRLIVYISEFDRNDELGNPKCRNFNCHNLVRKPYRKYCSMKCSKEFTKWYNSNFYWRNVRNRVLRRDSFTCQICGIQLNRRKKMNKKLNNWLECDHIIPKSFYKYLGYEFNTLEEKVKTILDFVHNISNLRTVCYKCHRKISNDILRTKSGLLVPTGN